MKLRETSIWVAAILLITGFSVLPVSAQTRVERSPETAEPSRQFGAEAGAIVLEAQTSMAQNQYDDALNKLSEALTLHGLSAYEQSIIFQMEGSCFYELDQYEQSIAAFQKAIDSGGLLKAERRALEFNIAQLLIASEQFEKGALLIEQWHRSGGQFKKGYLEMLWQAWAQAGKYDRALPWAEQWFGEAGPSRIRKHFDTLNFMYNTLGMPDKQMGIVEQMIEKWPDDKALWDALVSMLASNGREEEAFELALRQYDAGLVTDERDLLKLVQYHSYYNIPYQGAKLMQAELAAGGISKTADHYTQLADLWRQAREYRRAIPVLEQAVALSGGETAPMLSKLAEAYYHQGDCAQARHTIDKIKALGSDNLSGLYTQLGVCYYEKSQDLPKSKCGNSRDKNTGRRDTQKLALEAFAASNDHKQGRDKSVHKTALSWTNFIKGEQASRQDMCEAIIVAERDQCFQAIDQAYDAKVFVGDFKVDQICLKHKAEFDRVYRSSMSEK